jgi:hypothetical protein
VQQGGSVHDLKIGAFSQRQTFSHAVYAFDMVKAVHWIGGRVPLTGSFQG